MIPLHPKPYASHDCPACRQPPEVREQPERIARRWRNVMAGANGAAADVRPADTRKAAVEPGGCDNGAERSGAAVGPGVRS
jgi:hypothetical protein